MHFGGAARSWKTLFSFPLFQGFCQNQVIVVPSVLGYSACGLCEPGESWKYFISITIHHAQSIQLCESLPLPWSWPRPRWRGIYQSEWAKEEWSLLSWCGAAVAPGTSRGKVVFSRTGRPGAWCRCPAGTGTHMSSWAAPVRPVFLVRPRRNCVERRRPCRTESGRQRQSDRAVRHFIT